MVPLLELLSRPESCVLWPGQNRPPPRLLIDRPRIPERDQREGLLFLEELVKRAAARVFASRALLAESAELVPDS